MSNEILFLGIIIYLGISLLLGPKVYFWTLNYFGEKKLAEIGLKLSDLEFSFEQIDYLIATPSVSYKFSALDSIQIKKVKQGIFWPQLHALRINYQLPNGKEKTLALMAKDRFPVPLLDTLLYHNQINDREYKLLTSYLFAHDRTQELIKQEVKKRITEGRDIITKLDS